MAIREKKGRPKPYVVYWRNPFTGRQESESYATRKEAERGDDLIKFRMKHERDTFRRAAPEKPKEDAPDNSFEAICYAFLREKQYRKNTFSAVITSLKPALASVGRKRIDCVTKQDIAQIVISLTERGIKPTSLRAYIGRIFSVLHWAKKRGVIDTVPDAPELPHGKSEHFVPPTPEECAEIMRHARPHIQRVVIIGSKLGMRVGPCELFKLRWQDVDFARAVVRVQAAAKNTQEPWREVPIKSSLLPLLRIWHEQDMKEGVDYVIHYAGRPVGDIGHGWKSALLKSGITRRIRPYDLRHAFATDAIAAGADVGTVARLMGHADAQMVLTHYQHVMTKQKQEAIEALPDVPQNGVLYAQGLYAQDQGQVMQ